MLSFWKVEAGKPGLQVLSPYLKIKYSSSNFHLQAQIFCNVPFSCNFSQLFSKKYVDIILNRFIRSCGMDALSF